MKGTIIIAFLSGAVVGAAAMWKYAEKKWHMIADEEIKSVKMTYKDKYAANCSYDSINEPPKINQTPISEKEHLVPHPVVQGKTDDEQKTNYHGISKAAVQENIKNNKTLRQFSREKADVKTEPYVISSKDFGEYQEYSTISLIYDIDKGELIEEESEKKLNLLETLGEEVLNFIANDEETNIYHVRNELLRIDYEIQVI